MRNLSYHEASCCLVPQYASTVQYGVHEFCILPALVLYLLRLLISYLCYSQTLLRPSSNQKLESRSDSNLATLLNSRSQNRCYVLGVFCVTGAKEFAAFVLASSGVATC